ncbi:MAG: transporter substrate-binding domain-containing protein [Methylocystaceae bacterium]|nr:transporter substrate-binding domain-containing protein [Methylocystaceae bacterium]
MIFGGEPLPPYIYMDEDEKVIGSGADLVRRACLRLKTDCKVDIYPVKRLISMVNKKALNGIIAMGKTKEREEFIYFSRAYARTEYGFFTLSNDGFALTGLKDLQGATVVTVFGSNMLATLQKIRGSLSVALR